jgi:hypothetical protein
MQAANSPNHCFERQNVALCDGHVESASIPFVGRRHPGRAWRDNLFATAAGVDVATGVGGTVPGPPVDDFDAILLPTVYDGVKPAVATSGGASVAGSLRGRDDGSSVWWLISGGVVAAVALVAGLWLCLRNRRPPIPAMLAPEDVPPMTGPPRR